MPARAAVTLREEERLRRGHGGAYAADFRIATVNARFGNPEVGLGIAAAAGGSWRLAALVGEPMAKLVLLAGRILDADQALATGLVTAVVSPEVLLDSAFALAGQIAKGAPAAVRLTKALMAMPESAHPVVDNIAQALLFESDEKIERMTAFLEKRSVGTT